MILHHRPKDPYDFIEIPPPLCVWCNAPWTDDMVKVLARAEVFNGYYPGDDAEVQHVDCKIDVTCSTCNRLVYRKEIRIHSQEWTDRLK